MITALVAAAPVTPRFTAAAPVAPHSLAPADGFPPPRGAATFPVTLPATLLDSTTRDPLQQPFATSSIWNTPIGDGAVYVAAGLTRQPDSGDNFRECPGSDPMRICLTPTAPATQIKYSSAGWSGGNRCAPTGGSVPSLVSFFVPMPTGYVVPNSNKNECAAFLAADGRTVRQCQPLARCTAGGDGTSVVAFPDEDLYGAGIGGAQGGSKLSALGGALRLGEMRPGQPGPKHVLKIILDSTRFLYKTTVDANTYRWPATASDSGSTNPSTGYGSKTNNTNTAMKMGALLALQPSSTLPTTLRTLPGKQMAWTLQNYGCYIVDSAGGGDYLFSTEEGYHGSFLDQFLGDWGFKFDQRTNPNTEWVQDIQDIVEALYVVNNNSPSTVGGGGTPRQPPVPELIAP